MKINKTIFFAFFLVVINISAVFAEDNPLPPPQQASKKSGGATNRAEPLPGMPINQDLVYLVVAGLALGVVMIYKDKIKKASV
ncbi:hypothetical protein [Flavobacterium sp. LAR06]|uniref:hypothetical protein n=1 Tax=Flavobacterium sp. LAR06 TaxID=3064897 RepID=UPI0035BEED64